MNEHERAKHEAIMDAATHYAMCQALIAKHGITGEEIAECLKKLNVNEQALEAGGALV